MGQGAHVVMLAGYSACQPLEQGDLVGLCGLYAGLNAIRVVLQPVSPLDRRQVRRLMGRGAALLQEKGVLFGAIVEGMEEKVQHRLLQAMVDEAERITGVSLAVERPALLLQRFGRQHLLDIIDEGLGQGAAVVVGLGGAVSHYSVIVGRDADRYILLDSHGMSWIASKSLGAARSKRRYQLGRAGVVLLQLS